MSRHIPKSANLTALTISHFYPSLDQCLHALFHYHQGPQLTLKNDPVSSQHVCVQQRTQGRLKKEIRLNKTEVEQANKNRLALYQLLAHVLNQFETV
ncbi:hypothetical protein [Acinetobacter indicus]|uniref:hypothetical protein n=1 Tax=Acinetobacter indicus TaxID=756892 RepID=UPI001444536B|nr:hypothetical protein [Acinetobacter indicus]